MNTNDVIEMTIIATVTLILILVKRRDLLLHCFDPNHARVVGLPVRRLHYGLLVLLAVVASLKAVGIILSVAMLIAPGATAYLPTDRFARMLIIAASVAIFPCLAGTLLSFHIDGATGPSIVLVQATILVFALLFAPKRGIFT